MNEFLTLYFVAVNLFAGVLAVYDKHLSKLPRGSVRRVPEKRFIQLAALGGGVGTLLAMGFVRHKTKHGALLCKIAVCTAIWVAIWLWLLR